MLQNVVIKDENIFNIEEKEHIKDKILGNNISFYWQANTVGNDNKSWFSHQLINRDNQQILSEHADFFKKIVKRFADRHKIPCNVFIRGCINLTYPQPGESTPHVDHSFPHYQIILHLNQSDGGSTILLTSDNKIMETIEPKQFKAFCFKGDFLHYITYPKSGRRVVAVLTFI